ncbi:MFS transporter [Streptomyces sp. NPDC087425]|uniref:MFS transporter n=1 Tax=Streptomyces sp. NPDC087425 TaxID=3365787 RepID=UPI0038122C65
MNDRDTSCTGVLEVDSPPVGKLPKFQLLAFTIAGFLAIVTETMPAGLLPRIGEGLGVSEGLAGQLITLYAIGSVVAAIPIIAATHALRRRGLMLSAVAGLLVFNVVTALSTNYVLTLGARLFAGMAAGVVWGLLAGYVRRLVPTHLQGRALALASVGQPVALAFGVPLGTWLGSLFDWRGVFWVMAAVGLVLLVWVRVSVPDLPGLGSRKGSGLKDVFRIPGVLQVLTVMFLWMLAHNMLYTYIAPFLAAADLADRVDVMLLVFGVSALVGIWLTGLFTDQRLRLLTLASSVGFAAGALVLGIGAGNGVMIVIGVVLWGLTFGGAPTLLQTALADAAGRAADTAQSIFVTVFNLAVAGGGLVGGILLNSTGTASFPWILLILAALASLLVWQARTYAFKPGRRAGA